MKSLTALIIVEICIDILLNCSRAYDLPVKYSKKYSFVDYLGPKFFNQMPIQ